MVKYVRQNYFIFEEMILLKLNPDCFRDILLFVEENTGINSAVVFSRSHEHPLYEKYPYEELFYHLKQCANFGYISSSSSVGYCLVDDLTPQGHIFIADIRNDTNWNKTKEVAKKVGSFSLDALMNIASSVIAESIKKTLC